MSFLAALGLQPKSVVNDDTPFASSRRFVQKVEQGAYQDAEGHLANASEENRERLIYGFACVDEAVDLAARWTSACRNSSLAHTVLGASMIVEAWNIRGGSYAEDVDQDAWKPFLEGLKKAEQVLHRAAELDPKTAEPFAWLIHAGVGGSAPREELDDLFAQAKARVPLHWPTHYKYFMCTTQKWGGSHKEMFSFAQAVSSRAPRGSILHSLMAAAYGEYALAEEEDVLKRLRHRDHAARITAALYAWLDTDAEGIADKLLEVGGGFAGFALNHFVVACYLCGAFREARELIEALHGEIESAPWCWIAKSSREEENPAFVHDRVKKEVLKAI